MLCAKLNPPKSNVADFPMFHDTLRTDLENQYFLVPTSVMIVGFNSSDELSQTKNCARAIVKFHRELLQYTLDLVRPDPEVFITEPRK